MNTLPVRVATRLASLTIVALFPTIVWAQGSNYGQFAPADAYEDNSELAYYGSENEWSRRQFSQEKADDIYGRRGQRQLLAILNGNPEQALQWAAERLAADPNDLESKFMQSVAYCQLGQLDLALSAMQSAVDAGLPVERYLAGPRDLLRPLRQLPSFRKLVAGRTLGLLHGPMLGCVTENSAQIWVRTENETTVEIKAYVCDDQGQAGSTVVSSGSAQSSSEQDYTALISLTGLHPMTSYEYDVIIDGATALAGARPRFTTFSPPSGSGQLKIAFGGGAGYTPQNERMWDTIASRKPDALLQMGDNVYIDLPEQPRGLHRYTYYRRQSRPEYRHLVASTPVYAVWDDHDCAMDDVWMGPYLDRPSWKPAMLKLFQQNWVNPAYGTPDAPGCWFTATLKDIDFFFLDTRYFRTNPFAETRTMLGPVQKQRLLSWLNDSHSVFKVIVSSVPVAPNAKPGSRDTWDGFNAERAEILSWLDTHRIEGVVFLSADRHRSDARIIERKSGYPLYDLMSSKLTNTHTHECVPGAIFCYNAGCSFGLVTFDTTAPDPTVTYEVVDIDGNTVHALTIRRSQLSY